MPDRPEFACPRCPICGMPPSFWLWPEQAICTTDECEVFMWDMTVSAAVNLNEAAPIQSFGTMKDGRTWDTRRGDPVPELWGED